MIEIKPRVVIVLLFALLLLAAKSDQEEYFCKEVGYYSAVYDAHEFYRQECSERSLSALEKIRCGGMAHLAALLAKEMSWRLDHPEEEGICPPEAVK